MTPREFLDILHVAERLKDTPRHCTTTKRRTESVAEHSWRISLMALLLKGEFPEADMDRVVRMCLIHDLGECFTGDIPTFVKTDADRDVEDSLLGRWVRSLPPEVSGELTALFQEMDAHLVRERIRPEQGVRLRHRRLLRLAHRPAERDPGRHAGENRPRTILIPI